MPNNVVSAEDWQKASATLLEEEKAATRLLASIAASRRELPMVKIENPMRFKFDTPEGEKSLFDLFDGRNQLIIYHFMLGPEDEQGCVGCSFYIPDVCHLHSRDTTFVAVATAPLEKATAFKERMEWKFPLYSSAKTVEAWKEAEAAGEVITWKPGNGYLGLCTFLRDGNDMYHTYSTTDHGLEMILSTYRLLDMTYLGCQESTKLKHNCAKCKAVAEFGVEGETEDVRDKELLPPPKKKAKLDKEEEINDEVKLFNDPEAVLSTHFALDTTPSGRQEPTKLKEEEIHDEAMLSIDLEMVRVREWRDRLQKSFLSAKGSPKDEEMPALDNLFAMVENYGITIQHLAFSKIGKVIRHISVLPANKVPRDAEFRFRKRAKALVDKWHQLLNDKWRGQ